MALTKQSIYFDFRKGNTPTEMAGLGNVILEPNGRVTPYDLVKSSAKATFTTVDTYLADKVFQNIAYVRIPDVSQSPAYAAISLWKGTSLGPTGEDNCVLVQNITNINSITSTVYRFAAGVGDAYRSGVQIGWMQVSPTSMLSISAPMIFFDGSAARATTSNRFSAYGDGASAGCVYKGYVLINPTNMYNRIAWNNLGATEDFTNGTAGYVDLWGDQEVRYMTACGDYCFVTTKTDVWRLEYVGYPKYFEPVHVLRTPAALTVYGADPVYGLFTSFGRIAPDNTWVPTNIYNEMPKFPPQQVFALWWTEFQLNGGGSLYGYVYNHYHKAVTTFGSSQVTGYPLLKATNSVYHPSVVWDSSGLYTLDQSQTSVTKTYMTQPLVLTKGSLRRIETVRLSGGVATTGSASCAIVHQGGTSTYTMRVDKGSLIADVNLDIPFGIPPTITITDSTPSKPFGMEIHYQADLI